MSSAQTEAQEAAGLMSLFTNFQLLEMRGKKTVTSSVIC